METIAKSNIACLQNGVLTDQLQQAGRNCSIIAVYRIPDAIPNGERLLIITENQAGAEALRKTKWVRRTTTRMHICISSIHRIERYFEVGNPFVYCYYRSCFLIWQKEGFTGRYERAANAAVFKKKFGDYKESFYHDHDILLSEASRFHRLQSPISTYLTYLSIFEHDLRYLEELYMGDYFPEETLHTRINSLISYIPEIRRFFVRENGTQFFLITKLEAALKAAESCDEVYINIELYESVKKAEAQLYQCISARFKELKVINHRHEAECSVSPLEEEDTPPDFFLQQIIEAIVQTTSPEEIFLFHQTQAGAPKADSRITLYYLLVIGQGVGNEKIRSIQQAVAARTKDQAGLVILAHRRITVQQRLYSYQQFLQQIMVPEKRVYASSSLHPDIHWEQPYMPSYGDFCIYYQAVRKQVAQYFNLRKHLPEQNTDGVFQIFAQGYLRTLRLLIYTSCYSYLPTWIAAWDTWKLCTYANPSLENMEYLFAKISPMYHRHIDSHLRYSDRVGHLSAEDLAAMDEILTHLTEKLEVIIQKEGLA